MGRDVETRNKSKKVKKQKHLNSGVREAISQVAKFFATLQNFVVAHILLFSASLSSGFWSTILSLTRILHV